MSDSSEQYVNQAIHTLSQSDPIIKLLHEVRLGRMRPSDAGLRAVTEAWLGTYQQVLEKGQALDGPTLARLDPSPRLNLLVEAGVIMDDDAAVVNLRQRFKEAVTRRSSVG